MKTFFPDWEQKNQDNTARAFEQLDLTFDEASPEPAPQQSDPPIERSTEESPARGLFHFLKRAAKKSNEI